MHAEAPERKSGKPFRNVAFALAGLVGTLAGAPLLRRLLNTRSPLPAAPRSRPVPDRPAVAAPPECPGRRRFLARVSMAAGAVAATMVGVPFVGFVFRPGRGAGPVWRDVGRLDDFALGKTVKVDYLDAAPLPWAGFAAETAAWLRRDGADHFVAFTIYCTHTGCPVRWDEGAQLFLCPCHGGSFYRDGAVASGPPPSPLVRYPVRVRDGVVEIQTVPIPGRL